MERGAGHVGMTAPDPRADIAATSPHVAEVPIADIARSWPRKFACVAQAKTGPKNRGSSYAARDRCLACQGTGKMSKVVSVGSSFGESRRCLFSLLEPLSSPSQCLLRLFLVQLPYPSSRNCCAARKA